MLFDTRVNKDILSPNQMDCSLKPSQRTDMLGRRNKGKRGPEENGGGPLSEPEEGAPHSYSSSCLKKRENKRRKLEVNSRASNLQVSHVFLSCYTSSLFLIRLCLPFCELHSRKMSRFNWFARY